MAARRVLRLLTIATYGVGLLFVFVAAAYTSFSLFVRRGVTAVPEVVGLPLATAEQALADQGLVMVHDEAHDRFSDAMAVGRVLEQKPGAGSLAKRGGSVSVVLSRGRQLVSVPDLRGEVAAAAGIGLAAAGLSLGPTARVVSVRGGVGTVVDQDPPPGAAVDRGSPVRIFVASGSLAGTFVMPDLVNRDYRGVRDFFEGRGFRVGRIKFEPYEGVRDSVVLRQFPLPGHPLHRGDVISLVVAAAEGGA